MEVRDGYIIGIFNYCDRWCEACAFTSRCRLFADVARMEASLDPNLEAIVEAPLLPEDEPPPPPKWMEDTIDDMNEIASRPPTKEELEVTDAKILPEHQAIRARSMAYCLAVHHWLRGREESLRIKPTDPMAVISWFASLNASKIDRALSGLAEDDGDREYPPDHEGSAKVALMGVERSQAAWRELVSRGMVTEGQAQPFVTELACLLRRIEAVFPLARAFVRPGIDEPDAVARLT